LHARFKNTYDPFKFEKIKYIYIYIYCNLMHKLDKYICMSLIYIHIYIFFYWWKVWSCLWRSELKSIVHHFFFDFFCLAIIKRSSGFLKAFFYIERKKSIKSSEIHHVYLSNAILALLSTHKNGNIYIYSSHFHCK